MEWRLYEYLDNRGENMGYSGIGWRYLGHILLAITILKYPCLLSFSVRSVCEISFGWHSTTPKSHEDITLVASLQKDDYSELIVPRWMFYRFCD
ncbi:hypothetical protein IG631_14685 [Alternaria alternata]|nr:hypothetical protein IG631_14685 [Alternaria alternata]